MPQWADTILRSFQKVPINPSQADFHGPYSKLLNVLFPHSRYEVVPQFVPGSHGSADSVFFYEVLLEGRPIFIMELNPPGDFRYDASLI